MTLRDKLSFVAAVGRIGLTVAGERLRPPRPVRAEREIPARVEQLTSEWLTAVLCSNHTGAEVTGFQLGGGSDGTASRRALSVTYNDEGASVGLPTELYTKTTPRLINRVLIGVTGAAGAEGHFYTAIRSGLPIGAPAGYYGAYDKRTGRSLVLIEDIARNRGATFGDAVTYVSRAEAETMVHEMAAYHGALWEDPRLEREWTSLMDTETWQRWFNATSAHDLGGEWGFRLAGDEIPAALRGRAGDVRAGLMRSVAINARGPRTLLHRDLHPGNWFRLPDGTLHLYDWQAVAQGNWALDVAYALSAGLETRDRRDWERDLLALYLDRLGVAGGKPPSFDQAWLAYRQQMFHGLNFWTLTLLIGKFAEVQPDAITRTLIRRMSQAIVDLDSLDALDVGH